MKVPYIDLSIQHKQIIDDLMPTIRELIESGNFILGSTVENLEKTFAKRTGAPFAVGVANGTDALILSMKCLGIGSGDEVVTVPNSFLASTSSIALAGATPVFVDVANDMNMDPDAIESAITSKTKAIMPVHLTGKPAKMDTIMEIALKNGLYVIEDAAQAFGASFKGKNVGSFGNLGCFSLHPLKNLSACGDAGFITCQSEEHYHFLLKARNHGLINRDECDFFSINSRIDSLQAAILDVKLNYIDRWTNRRREIAFRYNEAFSKFVKIPEINDDEVAVFHTYIIQTERRDGLMAFLQDNQVDSKIHYPIPIHQQKAYRKISEKTERFVNTEKQSKEILSLPVYPELTNDQVNHVINSVCAFFAA